MDKDILSRIKLAEFAEGQRVHLAYLKILYNSVELIACEPNWKDCFNISLNTDDLEKNLEVVLHTASGYLQRKNKIAIKIAQMPNALFVKTQEINNA